MNVWELRVYCVHEHFLRILLENELQKTKNHRRNWHKKVKGVSSVLRWNFHLFRETEVLVRTEELDDFL